MPKLLPSCMKSESQFVLVCLAYPWVRQTDQGGLGPEWAVLGRDWRFWMGSKNLSQGESVQGLGVGYAKPQDTSVCPGVGLCYSPGGTKGESSL